MKYTFATLFYLLVASVFAQETGNKNVTVNITNQINSNNTTGDTAKVAALENEIQKLKQEQRTQLLRTYAHEWQMNRAAEAPHVLARKQRIERDAQKDGFTVEDMKNYLAEEKKAKKARKK